MNLFLSNEKKTKYRTMMFGISVSFLITQCVSIKQPKNQKKPNISRVKKTNEIEYQKQDVFIEFQTEFQKE